LKRKTSNRRRVQENPEWTIAEFAKAKPAAEVLPELFGPVAADRMLKARGRPKTGTARAAMSLRLLPETLASWKATGPGWQTRMAETLDKAIRGRAA